MYPLHVLITVPHAICPDDISQVTTQHDCDFAALPCALRLKKILIENLSQEQISVQLLVPGSEEKRFRCMLNHSPLRGGKCDLNRLPSRQLGLPYRKSIEDFYDAHEGYMKVVLDIHSFPADYSQYAHNISRGTILVTLLDDMRTSSTSHGVFEPYSKNLESMLLETGIPVQLIQGVTNDIMDEAKEKGIPSILIEFNEIILQPNTNPPTFRPDYEEKVNDIMATIATWILQTNIKQTNQ